MKEKDSDTTVGLQALIEKIAERGFAVAAAATAVVIAMYVGNFRDHELSSNTGTWGEFGDYLGGTLNPIFAFITLVMVLRTSRLQAIQLSATKQELVATLKAQSESAEALKLQNDSIRKQSFEQTFFSMLRFLEERLQVVKFKYSHYAGHVEIEVGNEAVSNILKEIFPGSTRATTADSEYTSRVFAALDELRTNKPHWHTPLVRYLDCLLVTLRYLRHEGYGGNSIFAQVLRAQLSNDEVLLIYFMCFDERWSELKELIESFHLLVYLNFQETGAGTDAAQFFQRSAFKK